MAETPLRDANPRLEWMIRSGGLELVTKGLASGNIRLSTEME